MAYVCLLAAFWFGLRPSALREALGHAAPWALVSFALLLAPLWFFAFGAADRLRGVVKARWLKLAFPALLAIPYVVFASASGNFQAKSAFVMVAFPVVLAAFLELANAETRFSWQDALVLAVIAATHLLKLLQGTWGYAGLAALSKLYLIDLTLYLYLVVRNLEGVGYCFIPRRDAFVTGAREWLYFLPFGVGLAFALHFVRFHPLLPSVLNLAGRTVLTFLMVAVPEEVYFRGILQNLLETRLGQKAALITASLLFGLSHFNKGAAFNWRYVLLAAIAGIFYGRAWRARRQVLASAVTHTAVDVAWSVWFRL